MPEKRDNILGYLGLLKRGGEIVLGTDLRKKKAALLVVATDTKSKEAERLVASYRLSNIEIFSYGDKVSLGAALGEEEVPYFGIRSRKAAEALLKKVKGDTYGQ